MADPFARSGGARGVVLREEGKRERERTALAGFALGPDRAAVRLDQAARDRKPEPGAPGLARRFRVELRALLEQLRHVLATDAFALVPNADRRGRAVVRARDLDRRPRGPQLDRV